MTELAKALGLSKKDIKLGGKKAVLRPLKLKHLAEFEETFGRDRLMIAGANPQNENPNDKMPTIKEMCFLLWEMISQDKDCPFKSKEQMEEEVTSQDIMANYDSIVSFFLGVDVTGTDSSSDSSDMESAPTSGQS